MTSINDYSMEIGELFPNNFENRSHTSLTILFILMPGSTLGHIMVKPTIGFIITESYPKLHQV